MAVLQSTYALGYADGYAGMVANGETSNRISRTVEDAAGIPFGRAVFRGTGDHGCTATPAVGTFLGITIATYAAPPIAATGVQADLYTQFSTAGVMTQGVIWVLAGEAVTDGAQAYVTGAGAIVDTVGSNTILTGWFFDQTAASGALVRLAKR
jgi:hypothetical protein